VRGISQLLFNESLIADATGKKELKNQRKRNIPPDTWAGRARGGIIISEKALGGGWADKEGGGRRVLLFDYTLQRKRALHSAGVIRQWWCW
jgi:hypothetical protein